MSYSQARPSDILNTPVSTYYVEYTIPQHETSLSPAAGGSI